MKEQILSGELTLPVSVNIAFRLTKAHVSVPPGADGMESSFKLYFFLQNLLLGSV